MVSKIRRLVATAALLIATICLFALQAYGTGATSTTTLTVSSASVSAGAPVTLTATVTKTVSVGPVTSPVTSGEIIFCDATAAHCDGAAVFGAAQLTIAGTAAIHLTLGVGSYSIQANFQGTTEAPPSASAAQAFTVTGNSNYLTLTSIASSGSAGNYTLTGTVLAYGKPPATGVVSFLNSSNADASVSSATLDPSTLARGFTSSTPVTEVSRLQTVFSGDFNNDGIPDLAVLAGAGIAPGNVQIYLGRGDGTFAPPVDYAVGDAPFSMAIADVNGDGNLDLIVTNLNGISISVLLGNGDGTFNTQMSYAVGTEPRSVAVGDFNEDGNLDLAVANTIDSTVSILLGNGDGTFQPQVTHSVHSFPQGIVAGYFSDSGHLDLAVTDTNGSTHNVGVLMGNGDATFQAEQNNALSMFANGQWLAAGDLRKNGTVDLVVADINSTNVDVLLGNNDGTFQSPVAYPVALPPYSVSLGDVNGDGILDLVVPDTGGDGLVSILPGIGDGTFAARTDYTVGNNPNNVALADFNGDGLLDVATANPTSSSVTVLLQERTETAAATGVIVDGTGTQVVLASYPGDSAYAPSMSTGVPLTGTVVTTTSTTLMASPNPAIFGQLVTFAATVTPAPTGSVNFYSGMTLLGSSAITSGVASFRTTALFLGINLISATFPGNATFGLSTSATISENVKTTTQTTTVLTLSSSSVAAGTPVTLTAAVHTTASAVTSGTVTFCDANAARCEDTAILGTAQLTPSGTAAIKLTLGIGSHSFTAVFPGDVAVLGSTSAAQSLTVTANGTFPTVTTISDTETVGNYSLTGSVASFGTTAPSGILSFLDSSNGNAAVASAALNGGALTYGFVPASGSPLAEGNDPLNIVTADFNNDGILDLAVVDDASNSVDIYIGAANGTFQNAVTYPIGGSGVALAVGDFNGDGKLDIVTANVPASQDSPNGTISVLLGNGDGTFQAQTSYNVGPFPNAVSVGDFNNDGIQDLAVANSGSPGTGSISILLGKGDGTFKTPGENAGLADPNGPGFIATGDFNSDGAIDLAVSDLGGTVRVFLGNGDGTFQPGVSYAAGPLTVYIVAADLAKNGKLDLVALNRASNTISVLLGNGDGTFQTQANYATGSGPNEMAIGDFNNDGKVDLAITDGSDSTISVLYGNGDGTFRAPLIYSLAGNFPLGIAAGDFNGDGLTDLAITNEGDSTVGVLLDQQIVTVTATGVSVEVPGTHNVLANYPGDASHTASESDTVPLMGNPLVGTSTTLMVSPNPVALDQMATFTATVTPAQAGSPSGSVNFYSGAALLGSGTLNSSGVAIFSFFSVPGGFLPITAVYSGDILFAGSTSGAVLEDVQTTATSSTTLSLSANSVAAGTPVTLTASVNLGRADDSSGTVIFCNANAAHCEDTAVLGTAQLLKGGVAAIKLTLGAGSYSFNAVFIGNNAVIGSTSAAQALTVTGNAGLGTVTTISSTGSLGNYSLTGSVAAFGGTALSGNLSFLDASNGNAVVATAPLTATPPTYGFVPAAGSPLSEGNEPLNTVVADFNNDGIPDLAVVDNDTMTVSVYIGKGDGTFQNPVTSATTDYGVALAVGDFDGDGKLDLVTANPGGTIDVLLGNGDGTFQAPASYSLDNPHAVSVGDFNNDGALDLAVANTNGTPSISILLGNGDGTFNAPVSYPDPNGPNFIALGDFNRDGITDLATADLSGAVSVFLGNGDGTFQPKVSYPSGSKAIYILATDLNGDGKPDLVTTNFLQNTVSVLLGKGDGTFQPQVSYATGNGPNEMTIGDFNGDGKVDLAVTDYNDTTVSVLYGNGDGTLQAPLIYNLAGNAPWGVAAGDFNVDGLTDLAVVNKTDSTVSVLLNQQAVTATANEPGRTTSSRAIPAMPAAPRANPPR